MLSRSETIRQTLADMEPEGDPEPSIAFSGSVSQVNIISHATITINSLHISASGELWGLEAYLRHKGRKRKNRKGKVTRSRPLPERP